MNGRKIKVKAKAERKAADAGLVVDCMICGNQQEIEFCLEVLQEIASAREKFPSSKHSMCALTEEVGELAKALLDESWERVRAEAVQVACMAMRVALDGDASLVGWRLKKGLDPAGGAA